MHVQSCKTAAEVWKALETAFQDNGLTRKVGILMNLFELKLVNFANVEEYVSEIMKTAQKLRNINLKLDDDWVGMLMLAGLPSEYKPMIMGLESSGITITADAIKAKLIQEVQYSPSTKASESVMVASSSFKKKGVRCYNCGKFGHISRNCDKDQTSKKEKDKQELTSTGKFKDKSMLCCFSSRMDFKNNWYLDSGATSHISSCKSSFKNYRPDDQGRFIIVANNNRMAIEGVGDISITLEHKNEKQNVTLKDVLYVPECCTNLLSMSKVVKNGYEVLFSEECCTRWNSG